MIIAVTIGVTIGVTIHVMIYHDMDGDTDSDTNSDSNNHLFAVGRGGGARATQVPPKCHQVPTGVTKCHLCIYRTSPPSPPYNGLPRPPAWGPGGGDVPSYVLYIYYMCKR